MGGSESADGIPVARRWNRVFRVLSREPRRQVALALSDRPRDAWVPLPEGAWSPHFAGSRDELLTVLTHQHLPVLAEAEYVRWRTSPFEVTRGPNFDELAVVLDAVSTRVDELPRDLVSGCEMLERRLD